MKKLYGRSSKGTVHPSSLPPGPLLPGHVSSLSFLPAAILTLTAALSLQDREVLAYLISCSSNNSNFKTTSNHSDNYGNDSHPPLFSCGCFWCYMSYWVRWDASPNRHLIHDIIDAFEDSLLAEKQQTTTTKGYNCNNSSNNRSIRKCSRREKKRKARLISSAELSRSEMSLKCESNSAEERSGGGGGLDEEIGSVRRLVGFIGERIWGVLGQLL